MHGHEAANVGDGHEFDYAQDQEHRSGQRGQPLVAHHVMTITRCCHGLCPPAAGGFVADCWSAARTCGAVAGWLADGLDSLEGHQFQRPRSTAMEGTSRV